MSGTSLGKITISRPSGGDQDEIVLSFTEEISGVQFLEFHMSCEEFAKALTGLGYRPGQMELRALDKIGMQYEHKSMNIPYVQPPSFSERKEHARTILQPYEVDGWLAHDDDYTNHHNWFRNKEGKGFQRVHFGRHVPAKQT